MPLCQFLIVFTKQSPLTQLARPWLFFLCTAGVCVCLCLCVSQHEHIHKTKKNRGSYLSISLCAFDCYYFIVIVNFNITTIERYHFILLFHIRCCGHCLNLNFSILAERISFRVCVCLLPSVAKQVEYRFWLWKLMCQQISSNVECTQSPADTRAYHNRIDLIFLALWLLVVFFPVRRCCALRSKCFTNCTIFCLVVSICGPFLWHKTLNS